MAELLELALANAALGGVTELAAEGWADLSALGDHQKNQGRFWGLMVTRRAERGLAFGGKGRSSAEARVAS